MIPVSEFMNEGVDLVTDRARQREALAAAGVPVPRSEVVRSAWGAALCAERIGGWPLVLTPATTGGGRVVHHVADAREAALVLENGDREPWVAEERVAPDAKVTAVVIPTSEGPRVDPDRLTVQRWRGTAEDGLGLTVELQTRAIEVAERAAGLVARDDVVAVELLARRNRVLVDAVTAHQPDGATSQLQPR
jgi:phosphoribosylaminoimidazole carboxylase (NCAIR synthetase)